MNTPKPIKRHQAILKFSQEHHFGLLLVWKIREGLKKNIETERIALYTNFIFEKNLEQHFKEEESLLFTRIDDKEPLKQRVIEEHQKIYLAIEDLKKEIIQLKPYTILPIYSTNISGLKKENYLITCNSTLANRNCRKLQHSINPKKSRT
jgi:hypothetical protein